VPLNRFLRHSAQQIRLDSVDLNRFALEFPAAAVALFGRPSRQIERPNLLRVDCYALEMDICARRVLS